MSSRAIPPFDSVFNEIEVARITGGVGRTKSSNHPKSFSKWLVTSTKKDQDGQWLPNIYAMHVIRRECERRALPEPTKSDKLTTLPLVIPRGNLKEFWLMYRGWYDMREGLLCYHSEHGPDDGQTVDINIDRWGDRPIYEGVQELDGAVRCPASYRKTQENGEVVWKLTACAPGICPQSKPNGNRPPQCRRYSRLGAYLAGDTATYGHAGWRSTSEVSIAHIDRFLKAMAEKYGENIRGMHIDLMRLEAQSQGGKRRFDIGVLRQVGQHHGHLQFHDIPFTPLAENPALAREIADEFVPANDDGAPKKEDIPGEVVEVTTETEYADEDISWEAKPKDGQSSPLPEEDCTEEQQ
jgi:hypothetical protein